MNTFFSKYKIKLTNDNKATLKKMINIILILLAIVLVYYFIISSYLTYDKFIVPTLRGNTDL